ncbi:MAG: aspartate kinase, partial [Proteobacteria bacterium]|nr:aspartate kinase [Pseudomonadota bacterium]
MSKIVVKFGGTSVANIERILNAAKLIKSKVDEGHQVVVVVSAMSGVTNDLIKKSKEIDQNFDVEEYDALLSTGEQVTSTLFAGALKKMGLKSRSWLSWQIP